MNKINEISSDLDSWMTSQPLIINEILYLFLYASIFTPNFSLS